MKLVVGLGNPGEKYKTTRHNVGFLAIDALVDALMATKKGQKFNAELYQTQVNGESVILMKPLTFMNVSGQAIQKVAAFYKLDPADILVIYDDFELDVGVLRIREKGSGGTHNGMKSTVQQLGTQVVPRLRVGIGPKNPFMETAVYVLANFSNDELNSLSAQMVTVEKMVQSWISGDVQQAQRYATGSSSLA